MNVIMPIHIDPSISTWKMSSTQLLHSLSLLLLLPLRCRRNCNTLITLAIWLLSALSAVIHKEQGRQQAAEKKRERAGLRERPSEAAAAAGRQGAGKEEQAEGEQEGDTPYIATRVAHKRQSADQNLTTSRGTTSARGTGTGAALTSWQSSHSHRSPGASSSAQEEHKTAVELKSPPIASRGATTKPTVRSIPSRIIRSRGGTTTTDDASTRHSHNHIHIHSSCSTSPRLRDWLEAGSLSSIAT